MEYLSNKSSVARMDKNLEKISPFELKNRLIEMADESVKKMAHVMLNAGRGNPNWIATEAREAFFALGGFGIEECRRVMDMPEGIAGIPHHPDGAGHTVHPHVPNHQGYCPGKRSNHRPAAHSAQASRDVVFPLLQGPDN